MRTTSFTLGACLALALPIGLAGCGSSTNSTGSPGASTMTTLPKQIGPLDPDIDALNPNVFANRRLDSTYYIGFAAGAGGGSMAPRMVTLRGLRAVSAEIYGPGNVRLDSLWSDNVSFSGTMRGDDQDMSVTGTAGVTWRPAVPPVPGTFAVVTIHGANGVSSRRVEIVHDSTAVDFDSRRPSLVLSLDMHELGTSLEFILTARRIAPGPEGEYLPTGERFRIELRNELNETVWSSSSNKAFTQAIGPVEPVSIGREVEYRVTWDGYSDIDHAPAPAGTYRIVATIPAKPKPYVLREELTRSGR